VWAECESSSLWKVGKPGYWPFAWREMAWRVGFCGALLCYFSAQLLASAQKQFHLWLIVFDALPREASYVCITQATSSMVVSASLLVAAQRHS
jgi:hypothetical protein